MNIAQSSSSLVPTSEFIYSADWAWGLPLIVVTVVFHAFGLLVITGKVEDITQEVVKRRGYPLVFMTAIGGSAMGAAVLHGTEALMWAAAYLYLGALPSYPDAFLYSLGAMTTFGHANLHLAKPWQLMGTLEALDGMLLFGVTTAFLFGIIQNIRVLQTKR